MGGWFEVGVMSLRKRKKLLVLEDLETFTFCFTLFKWSLSNNTKSFFIP